MSTRTIIFLALVALVGYADDGPPKSKVTATLCENLNLAGKPERAVSTFHADSRHVHCVLKVDPPLAAGQKVQMALARADGSELGRTPEEALEKPLSVIRPNAGIAGAAWARRGGKFRFQFFIDGRRVVDLPFTVTTSKRYALLVSLKDYIDPGVNDLPGADRDAQALSRILRSQYGFPQDQITLVKDRAATRARIEKELLALTEKAGPEDAVVFYYTGHGGQVPDLDGDEGDGWDEAILPADMPWSIIDTPDKIQRVLVDDRIAEILAKFKTPNVTVIFDSCHSGTAVLDAEPEYIDLVAGFTNELKIDIKLVRQATRARLKGTPRADPKGLDIGKRFVFLHGCQAWETAVGDGFGAYFSVALVPALEASTGESWAEIIHRVRGVVHGRNSGQTPDCMGAVGRFPFSLAESRKDAPYRRPTLAVAGALTLEKAKAALEASYDKDKDGPGQLDSGNAGTHVAIVSGGTSTVDQLVGIVCDVYSATDDQFRHSKGQVRFTGQRVKTNELRPDGTVLLRGSVDATAEILKGSVTEGDRLVPRTIRLPRAKPWLGVWMPQGIAAGLKNFLNNLSGHLRAESDISFRPNWRIREMDWVVGVAEANGKTIAKVAGPSGKYIASFAGSPQDVVTKVKEFAKKRHSNFTRLVRLNNPSPEFKLRAAFDDEGKPRKPGEKIKLRVEADRVVQFIAFAAVEGGEMSVVGGGFFNSFQKANTVHEFTLGLPANARGRVAVKVLAFTKQMRWQTIHDAPPERRADVLFETMQKHYGNGGDTGMLSTAGWADATLWIRIAK